MDYMDYYYMDSVAPSGPPFRAFIADDDEKALSQFNKKENRDYSILYRYSRRGEDGLFKVLLRR